MIVKSLSTEFGKPCIWIEDLYIKSEYRCLGIGSHFFKFIEEKYPTAILRLEVEAENVHAVHVYEKFGFDFLPLAKHFGLHAYMITESDLSLCEYNNYIQIKN